MLCPPDHSMVQPASVVHHKWTFSCIYKVYFFYTWCRDNAH